MNEAELLQKARLGDTRALARALTHIENRSDMGRSLLSAAYLDGGDGWSTGITGTPGAGKSTLVSALIPLMLTDTESKLAVVAVDPSSPFTGGAILGDRIRMAANADDDRVYIRSVANRGSLGGISDTTPALVAALDGFGFAEVVIETVGIGQSEVEIAMTADTTVVVLSPGWGDSIQASKAGFLEIADIFVVNKADRDGADATAADIVAMLSIGPETPWTPPVVLTIATDGTGVEEVVDAVTGHRAFLVESGELEVRRRRRAARQLSVAIRQLAEFAGDADESRDDIIAQITQYRIDPWTAAETLI